MCRERDFFRAVRTSGPQQGEKGCAALFRIICGQPVGRGEMREKQERCVLLLLVFESCGIDAVSSYD